METTQNPRKEKYLTQYLKKCQSKKKKNAMNWVAESIESIADKIST